MLVAFGGAQSWTFAPAIIALAISAVLVRPPVATGRSRALDIALLCCLAWTLLQTVPLPPGWRDILSPNADAIDQALRFDGNLPRPRPLSIDPLSTLRAAIVTTMVAAMFWIARELCARQGARRLVQAVAWTGLAVAVVAVLTRAYSPDLIYGIWNPGSLSQPYGPFVNRNHMGTWLVMALPLVMGYIVARFDDRARRGSFAAAIDTRMVWLMGAAGMMFVAIIVSLSRSAAVGTLSSGMFLGVFAGTRRSRGWWAVLATAAVFIMILVAIPRSVDLGRRFEDPRAPGTSAAWDREQIWRETLPIVRDFPVTGTGAGSFRTAMLVYQQSDRGLFFNQAHNQYLQFAAEGGLILIVPLLCAAVLFARAAARRLSRDHAPMVWIRAGAAGGIVGVLVQSIWETGLRLPANGLLFAAICAIVVHDGRGETAPRRTGKPGARHEHAQ
jgi:putative inorganic carbon (HCO3(-)) transporter